MSDSSSSSSSSSSSAAAANEKPTFAYWAIRGLASAARMMFAYAGVEFNDKRYQVKVADDGTSDRSAWFDEKNTLGLDFPNLPYLIDGDVRITQSNAILHHLGRRLALDGGSDARTHALNDQAIEQMMDLRNTVIRVAYGAREGYEKRRDDWAASAVPKHFALLDKVFAERDYLAGTSTPLSADFHCFELVHQVREMLDADTIDKSYPHVAAFFKRFGALPAIAAYSAREATTPVNNPSAAWRGNFDIPKGI